MTPSSPASSLPAAPLLLGLAGLLPFLGLAAIVALDLPGPLGLDGARARLALAAYGALILSFLGGVRWGIALGYEDPALARRDYLLAVVPSLVGWGCLALSRPGDLQALAAAHILLALLDYVLSCRTVAPEWYGRLRLGLGAVAAAALLAAA